MSVFISPGGFYTPLSVQAYWRFEDAVHSRLVEIEVPQICQRFEITPDQLIDFIMEAKPWDTILKTWGKPNIKLSPFEIKVYERMLQGE